MMDDQEKLSKLMKLDARIYRRKHSVSFDPQDPKLKRNKNSHLIEPIKALWAEGASRPEIAAALRISESRVAGIVYKYKFERAQVPKPPIPPNPIPPYPTQPVPTPPPPPHPHPNPIPPQSPQV